MKTTQRTTSIVAEPRLDTRKLRIAARAYCASDMPTKHMIDSTILDVRWLDPRAGTALRSASQMGGNVA